MKRFYIRVFFAFALWLTMSLAAHFFSPDPWGHSLTHAADASADLILVPASSIELFFRSWVLEIGFLVLICASLGAVESISSKAPWRDSWRSLSVVALTVYALFGHIDREVMRWMGEHMTWSFIRTYTNIGTISVTGDVLAGDAFWSRIMLIIALLLSVPLIGLLFIVRDNQRIAVSRRVFSIVLLSGFLMASAQYVAPVKRRKLHRIDPGIVRITRDAMWDALKLDHPKNLEQAEADLLAISRGYPNHDNAPIPLSTHPNYPLWRDDNVGTLDRTQFQALPLSERPDVLLIVVETWRGWQTGLEHNPTFVGNPQLQKILEQHGTYFPYTHSAGFPSTEGILGIHLGLWSDPERVFIIDHLSIRSRSLPNILHDAGYDTYALLGFDPTFDNLTPALTRWYDRIEYDATLTDDEALVDRWLERYQQRDVTRPTLMTLTTRTTHAPYHLPTSPIEQQSANSEERYQQTLTYSDAQVARLIRAIQQTDDWDRTLVVVVGDHAQPTPFQREHQDILGRYTPGNTWTSLAFTGGWAARLPQGMQDFTVSLVDIAPTVLTLLDLKSYHHFVGRDLTQATRDWASDDNERHANVRRWPVLSMNRGYVMWEQNDARSYFHLRHAWQTYLDLDRTDPLQYGQLSDVHAQQSSSLPDEWTVERWSDAIRSYRLLLKHDRLMPP